MKHIVSIVGRDENGKTILWMSQTIEAVSKDEAVGKTLPAVLEDFSKRGASYMIHGIIEIPLDFQPKDQNQEFSQR